MALAATLPDHAAVLHYALNCVVTKTTKIEPKPTRKHENAQVRHFSGDGGAPRPGGRSNRGLHDHRPLLHGGRWVVGTVFSQFDRSSDFY